MSQPMQPPLGGNAGQHSMQAGYNQQHSIQNQQREVPAMQLQPPAMQLQQTMQQQQQQQIAFNDSSAPPPAPQGSLTNIRKVACDMCTQIKVKCSGEEPSCRRCAKKNLKCTYSMAKKRGPPKGKRRPGSPSAPKRPRVPPVPPPPFKFSPVSLEAIRDKVNAFAEERDWTQFHTPRNLLLALVGEVGELSEIFQWKANVKANLQGWPPKEKEAVADEMSDILIYLVRMAERCGIDLPSAALAKIEKNREKYPVDKSKGNSKKYTEFTDNNNQAQQQQQQQQQQHHQQQQRQQQQHQSSSSGSNHAPLLEVDPHL